MDYRERAHDDRLRAANDRRQAAADRRSAADDRQHATDLIASLLHDDLTGFYQRGAGMTELEREVVKAHRTGEAFTLAFVDIDGLKRVNDSAGHEAGDRLIGLVARSIAAVLRQYDMAVRYGGDEFVCGMQGLDEGKARERFARMQDALAVSAEGSASVGVAQLRSNESLQDAITRADQAMYADKARRTSGV